MHVTPHDVLTNFLPIIAIIGVVIEAARRQWNKFEARLDKGDNALAAKFDALADDVKAHADEDSRQFKSIDERFAVHSDRLAYLEGQAGVPLGSTPREKQVKEVP